MESDIENVKDINERLIQSLEDLPPLPKTIRKLQAYIATHGSEIVIDEVASIVSTDPLITASLLRLTNSPYYGFSKEIKTVNQALVLLGVNNVKNMIIADYARDTFKVDVSPYGLDTEKFLQLCNDQTEFISNWLMSEDKRLCLTLIPCVMFLRLGIMIFSNFFIQNDLDKKFLIHLSKNNYNNILKLERDFLGVDHVSFLGALLKLWQLDDSFIESISSIDYLGSVSAKIKKETYALAAVEALFSPEPKKNYEFSAKKACNIIKEARLNGVDFNLENFIVKLPRRYRDTLPK